ncbi:MAG: S1 RNA-binding domain-containing protein [Eubacteriales bacterium]|jgi:small subunit ribosomal protein S1
MMADETLTTMADFDQENQDALDFSKFHDEGEENWEKLKEYQEQKTVLDVTVDGVVNKGVVANVEGVRGFIPASRLALGHVDDLNAYLSKEIQVIVREVDEGTRRLILSAVEPLRAKADEERKAKIESIPVGTVMDGKVESIQSYGAFIDLGDGLSGLVHISQISRKRVKSVEDVLKVGQEVKVKVIAIKDGKLSLSMKALEEGAEEEHSGRRNDHNSHRDSENDYKLPKSEDISTNLGSLLKGIKLS